MNTPVRVFCNTIVLYVKIIVSILVGLYLTRIVLDVLGIEDFGIYNLIAGVIAVLAFIESSLMMSTQRYLSLALGEGDQGRVREYFSAGLQIHIIIALLIAAILELCGLFLFDGFLNIPTDRVIIARQIYQLMILSTCITMIGIPFNAIINAYEDIWFYGLLQIFCIIARLGIIFGFTYIFLDSLLLYTIWIMSTTIIGVVVSIVWCYFKYDTTHRLTLSPQKSWNKIREMLSFTGWNTFGAFAVVCRNQGISVVLNVFFGPAINGVFGIANQVDGQLISFANTLTSSMTPQIVKSQGQGNSDRLRKLSVFACKMAFLLSAFFALPLMIELPLVLSMWLKEVPPYAELYCRVILFTFLICEFYPGLARGIQAVGVIKWQQIWSSTCILAPIPIGVILFKIGMPHYTITYLMVIAQICSFAVFVYWAWRLYGLKVSEFLSFVFKSTLIFVGLLYAGFMADEFLEGKITDIVRFLLVCSVSSFVFVIMFCKFCFKEYERDTIINLIHQIKKK